jgi:UDP-N-acetylmuramoyl-tripeptide--D-alanyl-D-alanine ligase
MIALSLGEIAAVLGGRVAPEHAAVLTEGPVSVDSRSMLSGGLFVALPGEHVDGHNFAEAAQESGAIAAIGSRETSLPTVIVDDPQSALGRLAHYVVSCLPALTVFAITGSQGKTGTKDYLAEILSRVGPTVATLGNFNNEVGVPLTLLRADETTRFLVVEMGARAQGDISYLCSLAGPEFGAVLNVGTAHLGEFGSRAAIAQAKGELVEELPEHGVAVLNADDPLSLAMASRTAARVLTFGAEGDVSARRLIGDDFGRMAFELCYRDDSELVSLQGLGSHQVANACAAAALALSAGVELSVVAAALSQARLSSRWRMELSERGDGLVVINDAYNANPASMTAAVQTLGEIGRRTGRRTVAVLGEMRELGEESADLHRDIGDLVAREGIDLLVTVGEVASGIKAGACAHPDWRGVGLACVGRDEAITGVRQNVSAEDVVLVKASRGAALEHVVSALLGEDEVHNDRAERDHQ